MLKHSPRPIVIHSPGIKLPNSKRWFDFLDLRCNKFFELKDVTIITWNNCQKGPLEESLDSMKIKYVVMGKEIKKWNNIFKIKLTNEALERVTTKYTIGLDSCDVIVLDDPNKIVSRFKRMNCKMLFNSQSCCYPRKDSKGQNYDFVEYENSLIENRGIDNCYLNAGAWVGETDFCIKFFNKCEDILENNNFNREEEVYWTISDQAYIRKTFMLFGDCVKLDYNNFIFQVIEDSI
jgi:hypothetical protein